MITTTEQVWQLLEEVSDPEVPVLTILDLGVVREVHETHSGIEVVITPTYSGCPAMNVIEINIRAVLQENGFDPVDVKTVLSPAWTTDWMTETGKEKLRAYGIAPPVGSVDKSDLFADEKVVPCPQCGSENTKMISQFGSTACKSLYRCNDCLEPFDYFKCH
ncbi:MAG: 1,2-phenylacetyl-CoA epoxidase subunit PaaD [Bacteroidota bacterium]